MRIDSHVLESIKRMHLPTLVQGYATLRERTSDRVATLDRARTALGAAELPLNAHQRLWQRRGARAG